MINTENNPIIKAKSLIMKHLTESEDLIIALNHKDVSYDENPSDAINKCIFSRVRIPGTLKEDINYICYSVRFEKNFKNDRFKDMIVTFWAVSPESDIVTNWNANRHDVLGGILEDIFVWSNKLGFKVNIENDDEVVMENRYHARVLKLRYLNFNNLDQQLERGV